MLNINHLRSLQYANRWSHKHSYAGISRVMQYMLIVVAALLLTSCDRGDAKLRKLIAGSWVGDHYQNDYELILSPDGSFVARWAGSNTRYTYQGIWEIQDHCMVSTLTNTIVEGTTNAERIGSVDRDVIIRVDAVDLVISNSSPPLIVSLKRK